eukprot:1443166-Pyramimonas_sp.AAC.2
MQTHFSGAAQQITLYIISAYSISNITPNIRCREGDPGRGGLQGVPREPQLPIGATRPPAREGR